MLTILTPSNQSKYKEYDGKVETPITPTNTPDMGGLGVSIDSDASILFWEHCVAKDGGEW